MPPPPKPVPVTVDTPDDLPVAIREAAFNTGRVLIPPECLPGDGSYDLVLFFHGAPPSLRKSLARSGLNAAVFTENIGVMSAVYSERFGMESALDAELHWAEKLVNQVCPHPARRVRRIALAGWSAGYGAVTRMLNHSSIVDRVSAVLLADGFHTAFIDPVRRELPQNAFLGVEAFARLAMDQQRLLVVTHTEIETRDYASTTESTNFFLKRIGVERRAEPADGPLPGMKRLTSAQRGLFVLEGYAGGNERAHADQLHAVGDTFFKRLASYWSGALGAPSGAPHLATPAPSVDLTVEVRGDVTCTSASGFVDCRADVPAEEDGEGASPAASAPRRLRVR
jgi:hypothetical protein